MARKKTQSSKLTSNAVVETEVEDNAVNLRQKPQASAYEQLLAEIAPFLSSVNLAELKDEERAFLSGKTGIAEPRVAALSRATQLALETGLPADVFYAFACQDLSLDLEALFASSPGGLRAALETAIKENLIPSRLKDSLSEIMEQLSSLRLRYGPSSEYDRLLATVPLYFPETPLAKITKQDIASIAKRSGESPKKVETLIRSIQRSAETGLPAAVFYGLVSQRIPIDMQGLYTRSTAELHRALSKAVEKEAIPAMPPDEQEQILERLEGLRPRPLFGELLLSDLIREIPAGSRKGLAKRLEKLGVDSPTALLETGAAQIIDGEGLGEAQAAALREMETHARLALLEVSGPTRQVLIGRGFSSPADIAATPAASFEKTFGPLLGTQEAVRIHAAASLQRAFLENLATSARLERQLISASVTRSSRLATLPDSAPADCGCKDCEAATSPLAYLADLLTYIWGRMSWVSSYSAPGDPVTPEVLSGLLYQPFGDLQLSCESVEQDIPQVRLEIEAILGLMSKNLAGQPDVACAPLSHRVSFAFAADVDGDRQDELILAFEEDLSSMLTPRSEIGAGFWVMRYNKRQSRWLHVAPGDDPTAATFFLPPGMKVKFAFAGTLKQDTSGRRANRQQIILVLEKSSGIGYPILALEFDPVNLRWNHVSVIPAGSQTGVDVGGIFDKGVVDLMLPDISITGSFAADVDGDDFDEFIAFGSTATQTNAFWVYKLQGLGFWGQVGTVINPNDVAFECYTPALGGANYPIEFAIAGDVNRDGRAELIAFPDATGSLGKNPWIMLYNPAYGLWSHLLPLGTNPIDADADLGAYPWPTLHALTASVSSINSPELVISPDPLSTPPPDPNRFSVFSYQPAVPPTTSTPWFNEISGVDCSTTNDRIRWMIAADVDGDLYAELILFTRRGNRQAAWVMDRTTTGAWQHLSPIGGHPLEADLEWTPGGEYGANLVFAADIDGDSQDEVVIVGSSCTQIWVLKYDRSGARWLHVRAPARAAAPPYEATTYQALLAQLGASYEELRLARTADESSRRVLADRLSVALGSRTGSSGDRLDQLLLDPLTVTQRRLEELFGLVDTTRDPLSSVLVSGDTRKQTRRWRLEGLSWSADPATTVTDLEGKIYVSIDRLPSGRVTINLYRDAARGWRVATGEGPARATLRLSSLNGSGLSGWVDLDYQMNTAAIELTALPQLACWQWQRLRQQWDEEDDVPSPFTAATISPTVPLLLPIIDPDLIGPDDFRLPLPTGQPNGAFDIWLKRRNWVDSLLQTLEGLQPNLPAMLESLRPPAGAPTPTDYPWHAAPPLSDFPKLLKQLSTGETQVVEETRQTVQDKLHLSIEAFNRLMALRERQAAGTEPLMASDWAEVRSILVQAYKQSRFGNWRNEERTAKISLDGDIFASTLATPTEGSWPPERAQGVPLVDPERMALIDLPVSLAGVEAWHLWRERSEGLVKNLDVIRAARPAGCESVLVAGLGTAPAPLTWAAWINARTQELRSTDPATIAQAERAIQTNMPGVNISMFRRLAAVEARLLGGTPTEAEWADVESIMATARKYRVLYPQWINAEKGVRPLPYWKARRAQLPRWRARLEVRAQWEQTLQDRCRPPVVDPDHLPPTWLRHPASRAYELYFGRPVVGAKPGRLSELGSRENTLRDRITAAATSLAGLDAAMVEALAPGNERARLLADTTARRQAGDLEQVLGEIFGDQVDELSNLFADLSAGGTKAGAAQKRILEELCFSMVSDFQTLLAARQNPAAITAAQWQAIDNTLVDLCLVAWLVNADRRASKTGFKLNAILGQLGFTPSDWRRLRATRRLAAQGGPPLLQAEVDEAVAILMRADKVRRYSRWRDEERGDGHQEPVRLGPDTFSEPPAPANDDPPWEPPAWRVTPSELRRWRDTLETRADQHRQVLASLVDAAGRVEEATLPLLRNHLLAQLPVAGTGTDAAARWVADHLLINPTVEGCQRTTRVAHAIDTLLALIWSVRTGQTADTYPGLRLDDRTFEQDWRWIGSYSAWRSAVLVHLYPENLLHPNLRRDQSPAFRLAVEELRSTRRLTPARARRIAGDYARYFRDICGLDVDRMACVTTWTVYDPKLLVGSDGKPGFCEHRFALSSESRRVYWSLASVHKKGLEQGFWKQLDQFTGQVLTLVGATQCSARENSWVYLFVQIEDEGKQSLIYCRYDLTVGTWESDITPLEAPSGVTEFTAWLLPVPFGQPPRIAFEFLTERGGARQTNRVSRSLSIKGTGWERKEFEILSEGQWQSVGNNIVATHTGARAILAGDFDGDGRDELAFVYDTLRPPAFLRFDGTSWISMPSPAQPIPSDAFVTTGRFAPTSPGDMTDQLVYITRSGGLDRIRRYRFQPNLQTWASVSIGPNWPYNTRLAVAGDFDGDGMSELALNLDRASVPTFHILKGLTFQTALTLQDAPDHLDRNDKNLNASFRCVSPGVYAPAGFAVSGDFDGDGRDELAVALASLTYDISRGNDFWVMDLRHTSGGWAPLGPVVNTTLGTVWDFYADNSMLLGAVCGDFDGDGRDELAVIPYVQTPNRGTAIPVIDFVPDPRDPDPAVGGTWRPFQTIDLTYESVPVANAVTGDFDGDGFDEIALFGNEKLWVFKYNLLSGSWILLPSGILNPGTSAAFTASGNFAGPALSTPRRPRRGARGRGMPCQLALVPGSIAFVMSSVTSASQEVLRRVIGIPDANRPALVLSLATPSIPKPCKRVDVTPLYDGRIGGWLLNETVDLSSRRLQTRQALVDNASRPSSVQAYIWEAFYGLPLQIALAFQRVRSYDSALDWFRLIYDYGRPEPVRKLYYGLEDIGPKDTALGLWYRRAVLDWVRDPLNPHSIAAIRAHTYTRGTVLLLISCLLDYADAEFTQDTSEAIARARILYDTALELLSLPELNQRFGGCSDVIARIPVDRADPVLRTAAHRLETALLLLGDRNKMVSTANEISVVLESPGELPQRLARAEEVLATALSNVGPRPTLSEVVDSAPKQSISRQAYLLRTPGLINTVTELAAAPSLADSALSAVLDGPVLEGGSPIVPSSSLLTGTQPGALPGVPYSLDNKHGFCVSPNPILKALRLRAELNRYKIDTCRNIAGMRRTLEYYSSPTDQTSGLPIIGLDGQLVLPQSAPLTPTPYRYIALIQRAKELAAQAQQLESHMLASLEKRDAEAFTLLQARQDIQSARATVRLQDLRVKEAEDQVTLAELQQQRAEIEANHYQQLLDAGETQLEQEAIGWLQAAATWQYLAAGSSAAAAIASGAAAYTATGTNTISQKWSAIGSALSSTAGAFSSLASAASTWSQIQQMRASTERTRQEWQLRVQLANQDQRIASQQIRIDNDQLRVVEQELVISELQTDHAEQLLDFHKTKFTSLELYEWMSNILEQAYSYFLQQATAMAQVAATQLAFERQEGQPPAIQPDYWEPAAEGLVGDGAQSGPDRRGLTGSARLLQDIYQLDQWAFDTNKRKLQLSKTFSLAQLAPIEFEQLRTTGLMTFTTPLQLFDYETPGNYLRLIKRVSVTIVALVPPSQGINATLSNMGMSRAVIGSDVFQPVIVRHPPESLSLNSPVNATGLFTFETQPEFVNPFESLGFDTTWELRIPRPGNLFDYNTLADVLITFDYTALNSDGYRQQVIRQLEQQFAGDRAFSLRRDFPDVWWDLHNPDQIASPFTVTFETTRADFPPNLAELQIDHIALLFVTDSPMPPGTTPVRLRFTEKDATATLGGFAIPVDRLVSTRRANGGPWRSIIGRSPAGQWELALVNNDETREWMASEQLIDVLLVVSYNAQTLPWPAF